MRAACFRAGEPAPEEAAPIHWRSNLREYYFRQIHPFIDVVLLGIRCYMIWCGVEVTYIFVGENILSLAHELCIRVELDLLSRSVDVIFNFIPQYNNITQDLEEKKKEITDFVKAAHFVTMVARISTNQPVSSDDRTTITAEIFEAFADRIDGKMSQLQLKHIFDQVPEIGRRWKSHGDLSRKAKSTGQIGSTKWSLSIPYLDEIPGIRNALYAHSLPSN